MATADGGNDPGRALALLWGEQGRPTRGPKPGLTLDVIVGAAVEIADTEGLAALSMRRLATRLGVGTATLYTYIPGRTELHALMLDRLVGSDDLPDATTGTWREHLEGWARRDWAAYRDSPWVVQLTSARVVPGPSLMAWYDAALRVFAGSGLTEGEALRVIEVVDGYVRGLARLGADAAEAEKSTGVSDETWNSTRDALMSTYVDFDRYPSFASAMQDENLPDSEATFEFGLSRLLDGIESFVRTRR